MVQHPPGSSGHAELLLKLRSLILTGINGILNLYSSSSNRFILLSLVVRYHTPPSCSLSLVRLWSPRRQSRTCDGLLYRARGRETGPEAVACTPSYEITPCPIEFSRTFGTLSRIAGIQLSSLKCDNKAPGLISLHHTPEPSCLRR
jgi:hypothetical protein